MKANSKHVTWTKNDEHTLNNNVCVCAQNSIPYMGSWLREGRGFWRGSKTLKHPHTAWFYETFECFSSFLITWNYCKINIKEIIKIQDGGQNGGHFIGWNHIFAIYEKLCDIFSRIRPYFNTFTLIWYKCFALTVSVMQLHV